MKSRSFTLAKRWVHRKPEFIRWIKTQRSRQTRRYVRIELHKGIEEISIPGKFRTGKAAWDIA